MPKFGIKSALFGYFWGRILKNCCHTWNQHLQISIFKKLCEKKQQCLNLGLKMPYLGNFGQNFEKLLSNLKSAPSNLSVSKILQKIKMLKFRNESALFGYFWARTYQLEAIVIFEISTPNFVYL